jgi:streptogramin lyase
LLCSYLTLAAENPILSTFAGSGAKGFGGDGAAAIEAQLNGPTGIARGPEGSLLICDTENHRIRRVTPDGKIETIAGNAKSGWSGDGGPATAASLDEPYEVRTDPKGNVFWVERLSHSVRKLDPQTGIITTVAGGVVDAASGLAGFSGDGGPATQAKMNEPHSIGFDKSGNLYICDVKNHRIRKVDMKSGIISTFCGTGERKPTPEGAKIAGAPLSGPRALDFDSTGNLWLALREGNAILKLDLKKGTIHHVAGTGQKGFTGDGGPAKSATLNGPKGISVGPNGNVYVADTENHAIRMINPRTGTISLVAGTGKHGNGPDGNPLTCALARPHGVFTDRNGDVFIGDTENNRIRVIKGGK